MRELWIATGNRGKLREMQRLLEPLGLRLRSRAETLSAPAVEEDQPTFAGNAYKKAAALAAAVEAPAVADDSGLCVDALAGEPGVRSARFAGPRASDRERIDKLLAALRSVPPDRRQAEFACCICLVDPGGSVLVEVEERCRGAILDRPRGDGGFGYDPVFVAEQHLGENLPRSFAELSAAEKNAVSHRGKALRRFVQELARDPDLIPSRRP